MRIGLVACIAITALSARPVLAQCSLSSDADAVVKPMSPTSQADANLIISMSLLPKLAHIDYASAAKKPACDLGSFTVQDASYEFWGSDGASKQRKAIPATKGGPIALVLPITDIIKAIDASKQGKPAPTEGYLLATVTKDSFTGWRFYTGMPDQTTLQHDMAEVFAGGPAPIFRNGADGKTSIFVPKS